MKRLIKRYENRKLYDTETRKYVSLESIAVMIREGVDIRVIDNTNDADITTQILTQVIFEEGKRGRNPLSQEMLHEVIRWGNNVLDDGLQQVRRGLDQLIPASLSDIFSGTHQTEITRLKDRIASLESVIVKLGEQLAADDDTGKNK